MTYHLRSFCEAIELELTVSTALGPVDFAAWSMDERNRAFGEAGVSMKLETMSLEEARRQVMQLAFNSSAVSHLAA
jgi:hypothetical protein